MEYLLLAWLSILPGKYEWVELQKTQSVEECKKRADELKLHISACILESSKPLYFNHEHKRRTK